MDEPRFRVLIVDDDLPLRTLLRFALARDPRFEVVGESGDGRSALQLLDECSPDVVLLDLAMPEMDGFDVLAALRVRDRAPATIVLTGFADTELERQSLEAGAVGYLTKGAAFDRLGDRLVAFLTDGPG